MSSFITIAADVDTHIPSYIMPTPCIDKTISRNQLQAHSNVSFPQCVCYAVTFTFFL